MWVVALPMLTAARVPVWGDELALWTSAAKIAPFKLRPQVQLGTLKHQQGMVWEAETHYLKALALWEKGRPGFEKVGCQATIYNYAVLLQQTARWREAAEWSGYRC